LVINFDSAIPSDITMEWGVTGGDRTFMLPGVRGITPNASELRLALGDDHERFIDKSFPSEILGGWHLLEMDR